MVSQEDNHFNFTKDKLNSLSPAAEGKRSSYRDKKVSGLSLQVTQTGHKSFKVKKRINGKQILHTLGSYPDMSISQARDKAREVLNLFSAGINPNQLKRAEKIKSITLLQVLNEYSKQKQGSLKEKTLQDYQSNQTKYLSDWLNVEMTKITRKMVMDRHKSITKKVSGTRANKVMVVLKLLFNFAMYEYEDTNDEPVIHQNPVDVLSRKKLWANEKPRTNIIEPGDLKDWFNAVLSLPENIRNSTKNNSSTEVRDLLILLIFTGLRSEEALGLNWQNIDLKNRKLTIPDTKNKREHQLPLPDYTVKMLENRKSGSISSKVFPGKNPDKCLINPYKQIDKVEEISGVTFSMHDLRRTFRTYANYLEIPDSTTKRLMNHVDNDVTSRNYLHTSVDMLRKPMDKIANYILENIQR